MEKNLRLKVSQLRRKCDCSKLGFETTESITYKDETVIGQKRAMESLEFGLGLNVRGYNIFVLGEPGSGKTSTVRKILTKRASKMPTSSDLCYVYNFKEPERPKPLILPPGVGRKFAIAIEQFIEELKQNIPKLLTSKRFTEKKSKIVNHYHNKVEKLLKKFVKEAHRKGLELKLQGDQLIFPPIDITEEEFEKLPEEKQKDIETNIRAFKERLADYERLHRKIEKEMEEGILKEERKEIKQVVHEGIEELKKRFGEYSEQIVSYLEDMEKHILENHRKFIEERQSKEEEEKLPYEQPSEDHRFIEYKVNVMVDRSHEKGAPVIIERNPTYQNLMGYFEYREEKGALKTDHTLIRPGALHNAWGGYLVLQVNDLMRHPVAWEALKKALRDRELKIEEFEEEGRPKTTGTLKPLPIPLEVKVILIGNPDSYYLLYNNDEEFVRLFKVKVDFESSMPWTRRNVLKLASFLGSIAKEEKMLPLHAEAVARIVEEGARLVESKRRITTRLSLLMDIVAEADYFARRYNQNIITREAVEKAIKARKYRHGKIKDITLQMIEEGTLLIDTKGEAIGQINGIFVYDLGDYAFGIPCKITARTYAGKKGVVNIEREVQLSGAIHDKGSLIIIGYLGGRYAQDYPLCFSASVTFEQVYEEIEGDSASCAELFALLSSLANIPLKQGIAVTGSVNQKGLIQPVGSINEKIEGVFKICESKGLTGEEGVIIPRANIENLMLSEEVIEAVKEKKFNIWAITTVDEGMEILTGKRAGVRLSDGSWEPDTINYYIDKRLREFARKFYTFEEEAKEENF